MNKIKLFDGVFFVSIFIFISVTTKNAMIYADDAGFFGPNKLNLIATIEGMKNYVPGRNFHMLWQHLSFVLSANDTTYLRYHVFQSLMFVVNALLIFLILRILKVNRAISLIFSFFVIFQPLSTEVVFWPSALPMHIFSTFFLLLLIYSLIYIFNNNYNLLLFLLSNLFFIFTIYTYDQATTAAFMILYIFLFLYVYKYKFKNIYFVSLTLFLSIVIFLHYLKLILIDRPRSSGPVVQGELLDRILNAAITTFLDPAYILALTLLFFTLVTTFLYLEKTSDIKVRVKISQYFFLAVASSFVIVASYLPGWAWAIWPRHHYLPTVFLTFFLAFLTKILFLQRTEIKYVFIPVILLFGVINIYSLNEYVGFQKKWMDRNEIRSQAYLSINEQINELSLPSDTCIQSLDFNPADPSPFYSEVLTRAMGIYTNNFEAISAECGHYPGEMIKRDLELGCLVRRGSPVQLREPQFFEFPYELTSGGKDWSKPVIVPWCK